MRWREYLDAILYVLRTGSRGALAQNLFRNPPTVGQYENAYEDSYVNIVPMNLPAEIPYLAPSQEWRIVWDSALDRRQLGERIESRFDGAVTYYDKPTGKGPAKGRRHQFRTTSVLDWATLHPVERLELLTTHDLARQEKAKLELLRGILTYFHYATRETREEVLRAEINRVNSAADELRERFRSQYVTADRRLRAPRCRDHDHQRTPPPPRSGVAKPTTVSQLLDAALVRLDRR